MKNTFRGIVKKFVNFMVIVIITGFMMELFDHGPERAMNEILEWFTDEEFWTVTGLILMATVFTDFLAEGFSNFKSDIKRIFGRLSSKGKEVKA